MTKISACCKSRRYFAPKYYDNFMKYKEQPTCMKCGRGTELINESKKNQITMKILYKFVLTVAVPSVLIYVGFTQPMPWYLRVLMFVAAGLIIFFYLDSDDMKKRTNQNDQKNTNQ